MFADRVQAIIAAFAGRARKRWYVFLLVYFVADLLREAYSGQMLDLISALGLPDFLGSLFAPVVLPGLVLALALAVVLYLAYRDTRARSASVPPTPGDQTAIKIPTEQAERLPDAQRAAIDTLITWLYREEHKFERQSNDQWTRVPAPAEYGQELYELLGLSEPYAPPKRFAVAPKPGFDKPDIVPDWAEESLQGEDVPNPWMPTLGDFSTITLTNDDLDTNVGLALATAQGLLAPDAQVRFIQMPLAPEPLMSFLAWSSLANKATVLDIGPNGAQGTYDPVPPESGPPISEWAGQEPPPWIADPSWLELVRFVGYRTRPFVGTATLLVHSGRTDTTWSVETYAGGGSNVDVFWLEDGELRSRRDHRG